eukprot:5075335-Prymnesium_polylepis.1
MSANVFGMLPVICELGWRGHYLGGSELVLALGGRVGRVARLLALPAARVRAARCLSALPAACARAARCLSALPAACARAARCL